MKGYEYKLTQDEAYTVNLYRHAMYDLRRKDGMRTILRTFARMSVLQKINYCYHIEKLAYDDVPWAKQVVAKATLLRLQS